jgi:hypothetical protein
VFVKKHCNLSYTFRPLHEKVLNDVSHWKYVMSSLDNPTSEINMESMSLDLRTGMNKFYRVHIVSQNLRHSTQCYLFYPNMLG